MAPALLIVAIIVATIVFAMLTPTEPHWPSVDVLQGLLH